MPILVTEEITAADTVPVIDESWDVEDIEQNIFVLEAGRVFTFDAPLNYETVAELLQRVKPNDIEFEFVYVEPGSLAYSMYGANVCLVTKRTEIVEP